MTVSGPDFRQTWLWRQAFQTPRSDSTTEEQEFFRTQYLSIRERAAQLVSRIAVDLPGMTVHDISHLDALWDTASSVAEGAINVNPAEAFVLGASILLHDAAMSLAAYPSGLAEVRATVAWKDAIARLALASEEIGGEKFDVENPPDAIVQRIVPDVLRRLHAERAEELAEQAWRTADGSQVYLVEDSELRRFYGPTIGQVAHSHWWSVQKLEQEFSEDLGALASRTLNRVDRVKLACLLRVADALHLDSRRAPRFLRAITNPSGISALHWSFQERLARPHIELDAVVFTTGQPFGREDAEAWWLAYDTLNAVDRELRDVDLLLQGRGREVLKARRVKGAGSPEILARSVQTRGWRPVDARLQVSDVPRIVENLGGSKLYGNDPTVALRELIQNAADAVQARRKYQKRAADWGLITVGLLSEGDRVWLVVEDNGIGMSEQVLTGPLLDFGTSFWRSRPSQWRSFRG
jgi:signal transduction histidine kinase